jgi:hypothetical protein
MGKMTEKGAKFYANSVTPKRREKEMLKLLQKLEGGWKCIDKKFQLPLFPVLEDK